MNALQTRRLAFLAFCALIAVHAATAQDIFRLAGPPGAIYANASFEQRTLVTVEIPVEHQGTAVPDWFLAATAGGGTYAARRLTHESLMGAELSYQLFPSAPNGATPILTSPDATGFSAANVVTSSDFAIDSGVARIEAFPIFYEIPTNQFRASGTYNDTMQLRLYRGVPGDPATHVLVDSATVTVTARMARLVDMFAVPEPGIRTMDLTITATNRLIATVHERSNADTGYEVSITSANLAAAGAGHTQPFLAHTGSAGTLVYSLSYGGVATGPWVNGAAVVTESLGLAGPDWLTRDLRISYTGSPSLPAGYYEDRLIITITAR